MAHLKIDGHIVEYHLDLSIHQDFYRNQYPDAKSIEIVLDGADKKRGVQNAIAAKFGGGDHARAGMSLVGVTADAAQMLVLFASADAVALAGADDFAAYKTARMIALAGLSGGEDGAAKMVAQAAKLLTDVASGAVIMPFMAKPEQATGVFLDVAEKATLVAGILAQAVS
jgi:hypothetical protein